LFIKASKLHSFPVFAEINFPPNTKGWVGGPTLPLQLKRGLTCLLLNRLRRLNHYSIVIGLFWTTNHTTGPFISLSPNLTIFHTPTWKKLWDHAQIIILITQRLSRFI
jgi:hypothetical protein